MKTAARKTENVMGKDLRVNDVVVRGGYEWVIDRITFEPDFPRYVCTCHWSGNGADPQFFNNNFDTTQRDDIPWCRVVNPKPRRLVCRTEAPAWYATQVGRRVDLCQPPDVPLTRVGGHDDYGPGVWPVVFASGWCGRHQTRPAQPKAKSDLTIRWNNCAINDICAICSRQVDAQIGPEFFIRGTWHVVCHECARRENSDLAATRDEMGDDPAWPHYKLLHTESATATSCL